MHRGLLDFDRRDSESQVLDFFLLEWNEPMLRLSTQTPNRPSVENTPQSTVNRATIKRTVFPLNKDETKKIFRINIIHHTLFIILNFSGEPENVCL